jgi:NADH:ubiquinone oxidoreductase subunit C
MDLNSRTINLLPYKEISFTYRYLHHTLVNEITIIIEDNEDYYVIQDDIEKVKDVSQMPNYIKEDWIKYNKKELTTQILDWHIIDYVDKSESQYPNEDLLEVISKLRSIKRNQIIKSII